MDGWIRLHRILKSKPIWFKSTPEQKAILITLLLLTNHDEAEWEWMGDKFKVLPGQFVTSLESIRKETGKGISVQNVRSAINRFKKLEFLTDKATKTGRLITICNWDSYQPIKEPDQQSWQQRGNKEVTPNKNDKNNKNNISVIFDEFRKQYPGTKRGLETELNNFLKKNKPEIANLLLPSLNAETAHKEKLRQKKEFVPAWKNLSTWINQKCWEQEFGQVNNKKQEYVPVNTMRR